MSKFKTLVVGTILGAAAMYTGLQYHLLLAPEGLVLVPRTPQHSLKEAYADVQTWDSQSWASHPQLASAVTEHGRADLIGQGMTEQLLDEVQTSFTRRQQQMGSSNGRWEPAAPSDIPAPIADGKIAGTRSAPHDGAAPRRGFLPLSELFGFKSRERGHSAPDNARMKSPTPVLPAGVRTPPQVEFLPSPDDVELGQPQPLPRRWTLPWRRSDADVESPKRSASRQQDWEPLSSLDNEREAL